MTLPSLHHHPWGAVDPFGSFFLLSVLPLSQDVGLYILGSTYQKKDLAPVLPKLLLSSHFISVELLRLNTSVSALPPQAVNLSVQHM